jgi:6-phosphogluconolactonase
MKGELGPDGGAEDYEESLRGAGTPVFDLLLLGIGPDGHCASLFPGQKSLKERQRLVVGVPEAGLEPFVPRISMTLPTLVRSRQIVFLATGDAKADAIARAFGPDAEPDPQTPSSLVVPEARAITVLIDEAAAGRLYFTGEPQ